MIPKNIGMVKLSSIFKGINSKAVVKNNVIVAMINSELVSVILGVSKTMMIPEMKNPILPSSVLFPIFVLPNIFPLNAAKVSLKTSTSIDITATGFGNTITHIKKAKTRYVPPVKIVFFPPTS